MKIKYNKVIYTTCITVLVFVGFLLYPNNAKAVELFIEESIKNKVPEAIQSKIKEKAKTEVSQFLLKGVVPLSTIVTSKVKNFCTQTFNFTLKRLGSIVEERISPENLIIESKRFSIPEVTYKNFIIKLMLITSSSLLNSKEKLLFWNKEGKRSITGDPFSVEVFFIWFISKILSPNALETLSFTASFNPDEILVTDPEKNSSTYYEESVQIVFYHNILQSIFELCHKVVDFPKKHQILCGIFLTALTTIFIIRSRPDLMEQMFMQSSSFITNFLTHLNNEIMDLKKKLANYEYDLIFAKKELQKQKDKYKDLTYKYKDLQTKHNFEKWKIGEQIKKFENLFNKHKKEFSYEVTKVSKEITYWKKEVKGAKKAYNTCESETKQLKNILKISRDNMTKFGQPKLDLSEKSLLPKKKIVKKAVDFLINLFNKKNETAGN